jgi:hypothetical protein
MLGKNPAFASQRPGKQAAAPAPAARGAPPDRQAVVVHGEEHGGRVHSVQERSCSHCGDEVLTLEGWPRKGKISLEVAPRPRNHVC